MSRVKLLRFISEVPPSQVCPDEGQLLDIVKPQLIKNAHNLPLFHTKVTARSANVTYKLQDGKEKNLKMISDLLKQAKPTDFIIMKLRLGTVAKIQISCTFIVDKAFANIPFMFSRNVFLHSKEVSATEIITIYAPNYPERRVILDKEERITYIFGIDYYGEAKMSLLRMGMEIIRYKHQGLGLHAGSKHIFLKVKQKLRKFGVLIFGLSGTGKTTLICHDHELVSPEKIEILQDDINFLTPDGVAYGTENGFYVKCDNFPEHKILTQAALHPKSILENVATDATGKFDWKDFTRTNNTRAVVARETIKNVSTNIDLSTIDVIIFNTRRPEIPPIGKLVSPEQGAAYYGLGESIITSAEDATRAGETKRVVGFDPFIIDNPDLNINRMASILKQLPDVQMFVMNTGYVGDKLNNISVQKSSDLIIAALRNQIKWEFDKHSGFNVPVLTNNEKIGKLSPRQYFGDEIFQEKMDRLRLNRKQYLQNLGNVKQDIIDSV